MALSNLLLLLLLVVVVVLLLLLVVVVVMVVVVVVVLALQVRLPHLSDVLCAVHLGGHFVPLWNHMEEDLPSDREPPV